MKADMVIRRFLVVILLFEVAASMASAEADPFARLRFLLGDWQAIETPAGETGAFSFKLIVQDHVIMRTNEANYAATTDRPALRHEDLLVIYSENGSLKADYFDSESHVIRYAVETRGQNVVAFISEAGPREPKYRLTYRADPDGRLAGSFEIAPPGSPDAFKPYLSWKAQRR